MIPRSKLLRIFRIAGPALVGEVIMAHAWECHRSSQGARPDPQQRNNCGAPPPHHHHRDHHDHHHFHRHHCCRCLYLTHREYEHGQQRRCRSFVVTVAMMMMTTMMMVRLTISSSIIVSKHKVISDSDTSGSLGHRATEYGQQRRCLNTTAAPKDIFRHWKILDRSIGALGSRSAARADLLVPALQAVTPAASPVAAVCLDFMPRSLKVIHCCGRVFV